MLSFTTRLAQQALGRLRSGLRRQASAPIRVQALLAGALLGAVVQALSASAAEFGEPAFRLAMALVVIVAGSASFVLYALQAQAARWRGQPAWRAAEARLCTGLLGAGVITSIHVVPLLPG